MRKAWLVDALTILAVVLLSPASVILALLLGVNPQVWLAVSLRYVFVFIILAVALALLGFDLSNRYRLEAERKKRGK